MNPTTLSRASKREFYPEPSSLFFAATLIHLPFLGKCARIFANCSIIMKLDNENGGWFVQRDDDFYDEEVLDLGAMRRRFDMESQGRAGKRHLAGIGIPADRPRSGPLSAEDEKDARRYRRMRSRRFRRHLRGLVFVALAALAMIIALLLCIR